MLRFTAIVNGEQLETLLLAAKAVGVTPQLGVEPDERPRRVVKQKGKQSTKRNTTAKGKIIVRLSNSDQPLSPRLADCEQALRAEFGAEPFQRSLARFVITKRTKMKNPSSSITQLVRKGVLLEAH